jgi:multidrug efflux pump subunit AcrA (membrane-fusion protein)
MVAKMFDRGEKEDKEPLFKVSKLSEKDGTEDTKETFIITEVDGEFVTIVYDEPQAAEGASDSSVPLQIFPDRPSTPTNFDGAAIPQNNKSGQINLILGMGLGAIITALATTLLSPRQGNMIPPIGSGTITQPAQSITVARVESTDVPRTLDATGTVAAFELIPVMSSSTGLQIEQVLVKENYSVSSGQTLAILDDAVLQAKLEEARALVRSQEARLAELKAGSRKEEIAQAQENVKVMQQGVTQAKTALDLVQKRVKRNRQLEKEGALARDRLDEILNQEQLSISSLEQAKAKLQEAQQKLVQLQKGNRPETIAQAEANLAQAKAQLQLVLEQLEDTRIIAPVSGTIAQKNASIGDVIATNMGNNGSAGNGSVGNVSSSNALFTIVKDGRLELRLQIPATDLARLNVGQTVRITSDLDSKLALTGRVRTIDPVVNEQSRQAIVKVDLPSNRTLKLGMFLKGSITTSSTVSLSVPTKALIPQNDGSALVYVLQRDKTVKAVRVETGETIAGEKVEIKSGLQLNDEVAIKGAPYLKDGDRVSVVSK